MGRAVGLDDYHLASSMKLLNARFLRSRNISLAFVSLQTSMHRVHYAKRSLYRASVLDTLLWQFYIVITQIVTIVVLLPHCIIIRNVL